MAPGIVALKVNAPKGTDFVELNVRDVVKLRQLWPNMELGISYAVAEDDGSGVHLRELKLALTTPAEFQLGKDV